GPVAAAGSITKSMYFGYWVGIIHHVRQDAIGFNGARAVQCLGLDADSITPARRLLKYRQRVR
ncbi:MAG: hypothetical protein M0P19_09055, partial [Nevskia sp.]|nr:hypothetical protein [Nevskia sp.]